MGLVGYSCNPLTSYLPRVGVQVANVSIFARLRYRCARISVVLRRPDTYCMHVGTKHLLPTPPPSSEGANHRKAHSLQYVTHTVPPSKFDNKPMDSVPASMSPGSAGIEGAPHTTSDANRVP
jgi:hypothetical protein